MAEERIFIVEDERIVVTDLQSMLKRSGYTVAGVASSGEEAVLKVAETKPSLVLMDIRLRGEMDGVDAAEQILVHQNVPVVYLTAYADTRTVERAKVTMPYGYILKPFRERDLRAAIEMAMYRHQMDSLMAAVGGWHAAALRSIPDGVITADRHGHVSYMNAKAESMTGWSLQEVYGHKLTDVFGITLPESTTQTDGGFRSPMPASLSTKHGRKLAAEYNASPLMNENQEIAGVVVIFRALVPAGAPVPNTNGAA